MIGMLETKFKGNPEKSKITDTGQEDKKGIKQMIMKEIDVWKEMKKRRKRRKRRSHKERRQEGKESEPEKRPSSFISVSLLLKKCGFKQLISS